MATGVKVAISARDQASSTLERINAKLARMQAPVRRLFSSLDRLRSLSGFNFVVGGFNKIRRAALGSYYALGQIVPVLGTITGAASVAGVFRLATAWGDAGTKLRTTARSIGMAPSRLKALQNATDLAGGSADAMASTLDGLAQTRWRAVSGFAPEAVAQFKAMGISLEDLKKMSPEQIFDRLATKIRAVRDPAARTIAATQLLGSSAQGLLPIFQQTEKEWQANIDAGAKNAGITDKNVEAAANAERSYRSLSQSVEGFRNELAESLSPAILPIIQMMRDWVVANRGWINQDIGRYVRELSRWLKAGGWAQIQKDIAAVGHTIRTVLDLIERLSESPAFQKLMSKVADVMPNFSNSAWGGFFGGVGGMSAVGGPLATLHAQQELERRQRRGGGLLNGVRNTHLQSDPIFYKDYQFLRSLGLSSAQASGMVGNEYAESSGNERVVNGSHYGLFQWDPERQANFAARNGGRSILDASREDQLRFAVDELKTTRREAGRRVLGATSPETAGYADSYYSEVPYLDHDRNEAEAQRRGSISRRFFDRFSNNERYPNNWFARDLHQGIADLRVMIEHRNAPPGSKVTASSSDPGVRIHSVTQQRAMDPINTATGN